MSKPSDRWNSIGPAVRRALSVLVASTIALGFLGCGSEPEVSEEHSGSAPGSEQRQARESVSEFEPARKSEQESEAEHGRESAKGPEGEREPAGEHDNEGEHGRESEHRRGSEHGGESEHGEESGESGIRYGVADTARETRNEVVLILGFDAATDTFTGSVTNTGAGPQSQVRVEVHLSNGVELGPTARISLAPGETSSVQLAAEGQRFETWTTHVEIGEGEHGERHR